MRRNGVLATAAVIIIGFAGLQAGGASGATPRALPGSKLCKVGSGGYIACIKGYTMKCIKAGGMPEVDTTVIGGTTHIACGKR